MASKIDHSCVWRGAELQQRPDWLHTVSSPAELPAVIEKVQHSLEHGCGAAMIRGLDLSDLDETTAKQRFLEWSSLLGTPVSQSAEGEMIFSVRDAGHADNDPRARGPNTRKKLTFHSDRCDVIGFLCLQQAKSGGENDLVSSAAIYNHLLETQPDLVERLMQPFYYKRHTVDTENALPYCRQPIFSITDGHFACNLLRVLINRAHADSDLPELTDFERAALDAVEETAALPEFHASFRQQPGDMVFMNNWVTLHRRSEFEDHAEPELKRHILRVWLSPPNNRPLDPLFIDNYGAVEAGSVRGGMKAAAP